jgi:hypothetical protein
MNIANVTISDWLIITATVSGPIIAVQVQKWLEKWREKRNRKLWIFYNLMATRAARVSERHVEALNSIQLEYYSSTKGKAKRVKDAWAEYHSHLGELQNEATVMQWVQRGDELFINLLYEMSQYLGFNYNRVDIQKGGYSPKAVGNKELLQESIIKSLAEVLTGDTPLKVQLTDNNSTDTQS